MAGHNCGIDAQPVSRACQERGDLTSRCSVLANHLAGVANQLFRQASGQLPSRLNFKITVSVVFAVAMFPVIEPLAGSDGLRSLSGRAMPVIPRGAPNALTIMMGEKAADMNRGSFQGSTTAVAQPSSARQELPKPGAASRRE